VDAVLPDRAGTEALVQQRDLHDGYIVIAAADVKLPAAFPSTSTTAETALK
jgi:hypothetical protein